jgi:predicted ester cyclase
MKRGQASGHPLQYQLAVSAFFVFCGVLKSPHKTQKSTHRCAAISVRVPAPGILCIILTQIIKNTMSQLSNSNKAIVKDFLQTVRSGKMPHKAHEYMAQSVVAHQMNVEHESSVIRSPEEYAQHINEFLETYGQFSFEITELLADNDKVYARWFQKGRHLAPIGHYPATGHELNEIASAVYRLQDDKIVEYWIQIDRYGFDKQLATHQK